jgi:hypothetical protein
MLEKLDSESSMSLQRDGGPARGGKDFEMELRYQLTVAETAI